MYLKVHQIYAQMSVGRNLACTCYSFGISFCPYSPCWMSFCKSRSCDESMFVCKITSFSCQFASEDVHRLINSFTWSFAWMDFCLLYYHVLLSSFTNSDPIECFLRSKGLYFMILCLNLIVFDIVMLHYFWKARFLAGLCSLHYLFLPEYALERLLCRQFWLFGSVMKNQQSNWKSVCSFEGLCEY